MADPITARVLFAVWSGDPAVVVPSPPGARKTRLVALLAAALAHCADLVWASQHKPENKQWKSHVGSAR